MLRAVACDRLLAGVSGAQLLSAWPSRKRESSSGLSIAGRFAGM